MKLHRCIICIGSNTMPEENLELARTELSKLFPDIIFGREISTEPLYFTINRSLFFDQLAIFHSELDADNIKQCCKAIEYKAGRNAEDKPKEIVKLDIDLLLIDGIILKQKDMQRAYVREGMKELGLS